MPIKVWRYWGRGFAGSWEADHRVKLANLRGNHLPMGGTWLVA